MIEHRDRVLAVAKAKGIEPLFVTVSGAHLYGFESPDSDIDFRGAHLAPLEKIHSLRGFQETVELMEGEVDLVSHEARKFFTLLTKKNGYVLEQVFSPLVVVDAGVLDRLRKICRGLITKHHVHHYRGFARNQIELYRKQEPRTAKAMLYILRVYMTGIHLMRTGVVEANIRTLNAEIRLPFLDDMIASKSKEKQALPESLQRDGEAAAVKLEEELEKAHEASTLPEQPVIAPLDELLIELRRKQAAS